MADSDYYDQSEPSMDSSGGDESMREDDRMDVPEEKLGLVPMSFFKKEVSPGDREEIEVVKVYENEVAIKCIYDEDKEESSEEEEDMAMAAPMEAEADELMG